MDNVHISAIIESICKKQGINYKSANPHYTNLTKDAEELGKSPEKRQELVDELMKEIK